MSKTIILEDDEFEIIIQQHQQKISDIDEQVKSLLDKKALIQNRIDTLVQNIDVAAEITAPKTIRKIPPPPKRALGIQKQIFDNPITEIEQATTFSRKIQYVFYALKEDFSTAELYDKLVELFPEQGDKNKVSVVQTISKELNKNAEKGRFYYKTKIRDKNGKLKFGLLALKNKQ